MVPNQIGSRAKTTTVHVGLERHAILTSHAIDVSSQTRRQITASQLLKFMIDRFADQAKAELLKA